MAGKQGNPQQPRRGSDDRPQSTVSQSMRVRVTVIGVALCLFFGLLIYMLYTYQVRDTEKWSAAATAQQLSDEEIAPNRGVIYDANMKVLARSSTVWTIVASPRDMKEAKTDIVMLAQKLAEILDLDAEKVLEKLQKSDSNYQAIKKKVEKPLADALTAWIDEYNSIEDNKGHLIKGISLVQDSKRYYPYGNFASTVLGFVNADGNGVLGLERRYNDELVGTPGRVVKPKNAWGYDLPNTVYEADYDAQDGNSLVLTIDETIQHCVEKELASLVSLNNVTNRAVGIVMNVKTGEILAMATMPDYDLNDPYTIADPAQAAEIAAIADDDARKDATYTAQWAQWRNKAVSDTYYPGSVFKTVTASMALDSGAADTNTSFTCGGKIEIPGTGGIHMNCARTQGHGTLDFYGGLNYSCNPYFIQLGWRIGAERFCDYLQAFGFTEKTGIDMDDEATCITYSVDRMGITELSSSAFGQSSSVTPIAMLTAASAAVNGGKLVQPHVVKQILDADGNVVKTIGTTVKRQVISETVSQQIATMLGESVADKVNGHGHAAYVAGYHVGGKSGTSQKHQNIHGDDEAQEYVASFFGFAPANDPEIGVLVFVDEPHNPNTTFGGTICGPSVGSILAEIMPYLGYTPDYNEEEAATAVVSMPNLVELTLDQAARKVNENGFTSTTIGEGTTVTYQYPAAGTSVARQSTVILYTDPGATGQTVAVPNVIGKPYGTVSNILKGAKLNFSAQGSESNNSIAVSQNVAEGTEVQMGEVIEIQFQDPSMTD